jgi:retron-type reverse transcriptase
MSMILPYFQMYREFLAEARQAMEEYLASLRLILHPAKSQLFETRHGANFLGFCILPDRIRVRTENLRRAKRRLKRLKAEYEEGKIELEQISHSIRSWIAHLKHGDTWRLRTKIFEDFAL